MRTAKLIPFHPSENFTWASFSVYLY
ncbi:unnamed protein product [Gulo gulo]|uniref:Uncharacterized protein n=1 Tax=Gulo gulo TaxID=48420 RepID=A0A9X9PTV1_GULGU|nr:unnamed protein product [Gulo gulo]